MMMIDELKKNKRRDDD